MLRVKEGQQKNPHKERDLSLNRHVDLNWRKKVTFHNIGQNSCIILFRQK
jgi:hypothetical protein